MSGMYTSGLIGLTEENVGIDRRFYTNSTDINPTRAVSYNNGRVDVYLNGVKLVGNHAGNNNHDYTMDNVTGTGTSITLVTDVALVASDVLELVGYVSNSSNTVQTYNFNVTGNTTQFTASHTASSLVNVYLNGVLLDSSDYTLNGSDTVTLGSNAVNGDVVAIQVIGALDHSDFVSATDGGTFSGNVTVPNLIIGDGGNIGSASDTDAISISSGGVTTFSQNVDINGKELILDADGDTSITADTNDQIDIKVGGTDRVQIDSSGNVKLKTTNAYLKLPSGGGINFHNYGSEDSSSATTISNNLLDDYEEGTWTPVFVSGTGGYSGSAFNSISDAKYVKIGKFVRLQASVTVTGGSTISVGNILRFDGQPFAPETNVLMQGVGGTQVSLSSGGTSSGIVQSTSSADMVLNTVEESHTASSATHTTHISVTYFTNS